MLPSRATARMLHDSLADTSSMQYSRSLTLICSPGSISALLPSGSRPTKADSAAVITWSSCIWPRSTASRISMAVITLVMLAGYMRVVSFFP